MVKPTKKYILWLWNGGGGYMPNEYDTVQEVLLADKFTSDWYITKSINDISAYDGYVEPKKEVKKGA